jgi:glycosyltransferase involved in cell wall biosynthesis
VTPLVSVVICVRDGLPFLRSALDSIESQRYPDVEIVAVDDGSKDASRELLIERGLDAVALGGLGQAAARNAGLERASGELVCIFDQDDELLPDKLSRQVALLEREPATDIAVGKVIWHLQPGVPHPPWLPDDWFDTPHMTSLLGGMLIRRRAFEEVGGFTSEVGLTDDFDWLVRAKEADLTFSHHDDVVLRYRVHARNQSNQRAELQSSALATLRRSVARKRGD